MVYQPISKNKYYGWLVLVCLVQKTFGSSSCCISTSSRSLFTVLCISSNPFLSVEEKRKDKGPHKFSRGKTASFLKKINKINI